MIILLDDLGFSDLGCFGSEIDTPHIDRLAAEGLRYADFSATPLCSPTRAALLTGRNHHTAQVAFIAGWGRGPDHTQERIAPDCGTIAEILRAAGYATYAFGKWHLAPEEELAADGPYDNWPTGRGFDRYYGFLRELSDQYHPALVEDRRFIEPPEAPGYHLSSDLVDRAIAEIETHVRGEPERPFLVYLAFGAVHSPYQVPEAFVERHAARYADGWDRARAARLERQVALGIAPPGTRLTERPPTCPAWDDLSPEEQTVSARIQAAYAAFVEHTDAQIGRLLEQLDATGLTDETLVLLLSDNGATTGGRTGTAQMAEGWEGVPRTTGEERAELDRVGGPDTFPHYAEGWGMLGNTPFRRHKSWVDGGGVRVPLIVRWPGRVPDPGAVRRQFCHVVDLVPTILDVAGVPAPDELCGIVQAPMAGSSLAPTLADPAAPEARDVQYFEMSGRRALWHAGRRAVATHVAGRPYASDTWALHDTRADFSEHTDLADRDPDRLLDLQRRWWAEAERYGVLPLDDRTAANRDPLPREERDVWTLPPASRRHCVSDLARSLQYRSFRLEAVTGPERPADGSIIVAAGVPTGWWALVMEAGRISLVSHTGGRTT
ncbi:MAG: arylsulfatase, partial [Chloroflexota bacterium]